MGYLSQEMLEALVLLGSIENGIRLLLIWSTINMPLQGQNSFPAHKCKRSNSERNRFFGKRVEDRILFCVSC